MPPLIAARKQAQTNRPALLGLAARHTTGMRGREKPCRGHPPYRDNTAAFGIQVKMSDSKRSNVGQRRKAASFMQITPEGPAEILGLRGRKKAQQRLDLIEVAVKLFKKKGYETVRMEDIAAAANVSTKTVYNYFPIKRDILIEFLVSDRERAIAQFQKVLDTPAGDPIEDLIRLMEADIGDVLSPGERALWLEIMAVNVRERGDERFRRYRFMFTSYIESLLRELRDDDKVSRSVDIALAAHLIHVAHSENFEDFCAMPSLTVAGALARARAQLTLLFREWAPGQPETTPPKKRRASKEA